MVGFAELLVYVLALAAVLLSPEMYDIYCSYKEKEKLLDRATPLFQEIKEVIKLAPSEKADESDKLATLKELVEKVTAPPEGLEGLGRVVMTLGVIAILGIVVIQLTLSTTSLINAVVSAPTIPAMSNQTLTFADKARSDEIDILKTLVTALAGGLTTMIGFYFGTKAAEQKSEPATQAGAGTQQGSRNGDGRPHGAAPAKKR